MIFLNNCLVYEMLKNSEKCRSQVVWAYRDVFQFTCFVWPTVQNPKIFSLLSSMTKTANPDIGELETDNSWTFCLTNDRNDKSINKIIFCWSGNRSAD